VQPSRGGELSDHFSKLERAIQSFKEVQEGKDVVFSEDGEFQPYEIGFVGSFFWNPPSLDEEIQKAKEFIEREIQEITDDRVTKDITNQFKGLQKQVDNIKTIPQLQGLLKTELQNFRKKLLSKQQEQRRLYVDINDLKEIEVPQYLPPREDDALVFEPTKREAKGKEPLIEEESEEAEVDLGSWEFIEGSKESEAEVDLGSWEFIKSTTESDAASVAARLEVVAKEDKEPEKAPPKPDVRHLSDEAAVKVEEYVNSHREKLFKAARKGRSYVRDSGLSMPVQIHLQKGKKTRQDEMLVLVHLKPDSAQYSIKQGRERNVIFVGQGAFKQVRLSAGYELGRGVWQNYATATLKMGKEEDATYDQIREAQQEMQREIALLEKFYGKPGVVQLVGHCIYPIKGSEKNAGWVSWLLSGNMKKNMVMSYAESDLGREFVFKNVFKSDSKSVQKRRRLALGVLEGLVSVHSQKLMHLDIKPDNILISGGSPLIADFGLACEYKKKPEYPVGTPAYIAPEIWGIEDKAILNDMEIEERSIDGKTDVFSAGVMFYEMYHDGRYPFPKGWTQLVKNFQNGYPNVKPSDFYMELKTWHKQQVRLLESKKKAGPSKIALQEEELILKMLEPNPKDRPSSEEAFAAFKDLYGTESGS